MGYSTEQIYFDNNRPIFIYAITHYYNKPSGKIVRKEENRYYFKQGKIIKWFANDKQSIDKNSSSFKEKQIELDKLINDYMAISHADYQCVFFSNNVMSTCN